MSDLISREDAIKAILETKETSESGVFYDGEIAMQTINSLPSAEAEWILVSEGLPSDSGNYLITVADLRLGHNGEHTVTMADFYAKAKKWNSVVEVIAWKPLPTPYKETEVEE